jgi:selenocysteine-specific elongation factor
VRLEMLPTAQRLKHRAQVHFHLGTSETIGELLLYGKSELAPGEQAVAQIRLRDEVVAAHGDRFIVRQFSPVITIGGGMVLDPLARRATRKDTGRMAFLETMERGERAEILRAIADRNILGVRAEEIVARTGWQSAEIASAVAELAKAKAIHIVSNDPLIVLSDKFFMDICARLQERIEKFHKENPLLPGMPREELRASLGRRVRTESFRTALEDLGRQKKLVLQGELIKKPGAEITLTPEEARAKEQIEQAFAKAGLAVPSVKEVLAQLAMESRRAEKILQILLRDKVLVRVTPELVFHQSALERLPGLLQKYKKTRGERIGVPAFKELTGSTRKYAIPLLEYLDRQRLTRRAGDERVIL